MEICRICLDTDIKLYKIRGILKEIYIQTIGTTLAPDDNLPQQLCWECAGRLTSFSRLRDKAHRSHQLMVDLWQTSSSLTIKTLKEIDRRSNNLISTLTIKAYNPNHSNIHVLNNSTEPVKHTDLDFKVKVEVEIDTKCEIKDEDDDNGFSSSDELPIQHKSNKSTKSIKSTKSNKSTKSTKSNKSNKSTKSIKSIRSNNSAKSKREVPSVEKKTIKKRVKKRVRPEDRKRPPNTIISEDLFNIINLSHEEQLADIQKRQESSNYKNSEFKCPECFKGFLNDETFKAHTIRHTSAVGNHKCVICKIHFKTRHAMKNHAISHLQRFSCKKCPYIATRRSTAILHEQYHKGTRYVCPHCQEDFVKMSTYMSHIRIKHPSDFMCELCGHSFISAKGLGQHKHLKHPFADQPIPADGPHCDKCDVRFLTEDALEVHLRTSAKHKDDRDPDDPTKEARPLLQKPKDGQKKKRKNTQCKPEEPIPCEQCGMQLRDLRLYAQHFRRVHPDKNRIKYPATKKRCICEQCGKIFPSKVLLKAHMWVHTGEKIFKCEQCDKSFTQKANLVFHMGVHSDNRPSHECPLCGKHFGLYGNMRRHMFIHTGLKPFKCENCGKCFTTAGEHRAHVEHVHYKKPWPNRARGPRREHAPWQKNGLDYED